MTFLIAAALCLVLPATEGRADAGVKTLDEITIEGEVRLPRVLFITSRETERPLDFLEEYLPPLDAVANEIAPSGPVPVMIPVTVTPPDSLNAADASALKE
jgi:hypothetical protein